MLKEKNLRTRRLFRNNGRSLVIAMDHAVQPLERVTTEEEVVTDEV